MVALVAAVGVCWLWIIAMARDMYGSMSGASAWMMTANWDAPRLVLLWAMWAVMMAGMMLPSATPLLLFYGTAARRAEPHPSASRNVYALAAGYVFVWALFSVLATALQRILASALILTPMMEPSSAWVSAVLLVIAGVYQMTPTKWVCLSGCQSPLAFLMKRWRRGAGGAFRMGVEHGAHCVGCCWALMLLLFAGGVMNLAVIAALTAFVAFEKLGPFGAQSARISGALLIVTGVVLLLR